MNFVAITENTTLVASMTLEGYLSLLAIITSVATAVWVQVNTGKNEIFKHAAEARIQILTTLSNISNSMLRSILLIRDLKKKDDLNAHLYLEIEQKAQQQLNRVDEILNSFANLPASFSRMSNKKLVGMLEEVRNSTISLAAQAEQVEMMVSDLKPQERAQIPSESDTI